MIAIPLFLNFETIYLLFFFVERINIFKEFQGDSLLFRVYVT